MKSDFEMIKYKTEKDIGELRIYPLGDLHIGSNMFNESIWRHWKSKVMADENAVVVIIGDLFDNGLKNSKTNCYEATMRPREQKEWLKRELFDIKDKIIGVVDGNHELRSTNEADDSPLYDVMCKLDLEDLFRENACFMKVSVGTRKTSKEKQVAYGMVLQHGASRNRVNNYSFAIDGCDVMITGHTHQAENSFPQKIVMDMHNEMIRPVPFTRVVVPSFQDFGGYALRGMYMPSDNTRFPIIKLNGKEKGVSVEWTY